MSRGFVVIAVVVPLLVVVARLSISQDGRPWEKPGTKVGDEIVGPDGASRACPSTFRSQQSAVAGAAMTSPTRVCPTSL